MTVQIVPLSPAYLEEVKQLVAATAEAAHWPAAEFDKFAEASPNLGAADPLAERISFVAIDQSSDEKPAVVGWIAARLIHLQLKGEGEIENIVVAERVRRRGVGSDLLRCTLAAAQSAGIDVIRLEVRASNRVAIRFYTQHDFVETGRRRRYYSDPEDDALLMQNATSQ